MSENHICPIWGTPIIQVEDSLRHSDGHYVNSPRAGGTYFIAAGSYEGVVGGLEMKMRALDEGTKAHLTSWLIEQRRLGEEWPEITDKTIEDAKQRRDLPISERADRVLRYFRQIEPSVGRQFTIDVQDQKYRDTLMDIQAWSESKLSGELRTSHIQEIHFFINYLDTKGWINNLDRRYRDYGLTIEGYSHLEELERGATDSSQAFVAMWFDDSMENVWGEGIKRGIEDAGYKALRIDRKEYTNKIDDEIIAEIRRSRFIVADFTHGKKGARGGVYYEAGFARGLGIPVIFTCRKDALKKVHFDTRQYNHIVWETPEELRRNLANRIAAVVGDGPYRNDDV